MQHRLSRTLPAIVLAVLAATDTFAERSRNPPNATVFIRVIGTARVVVKGAFSETREERDVEFGTGSGFIFTPTDTFSRTTTSSRARRLKTVSAAATSKSSCRSIGLRWSCREALTRTCAQCFDRSRRPRARPCGAVDRGWRSSAPRVWRLGGGRTGGRGTGLRLSLWQASRSRSSKSPGHRASGECFPGLGGGDPHRRLRRYRLSSNDGNGQPGQQRRPHAGRRWLRPRHRAPQAA